VSYSVEQGLAAKNVYPVLEDHNGSVWIGLWDHAGLSRFENGRITNYRQADGLPAAPVTALAEDSAGQLWFAMNSSVFLVRNGRIRKAPVPALPRGAVVQAIYHDRDGSVWLGTSLGLFHYQTGKMKVFAVKDGLASDDVRVILEDGPNTLWLGGYGGLTRLEGGNVTHWTEANGLPSNSVRSVYKDSDGVLWIGSYDGGLARFKNGSFTSYSTKNGLFDDGAFQVLDDSKGNLWMSCNRGIYRVSKHELNEVAAHTRSTVFSVAYGKADGMLNVECNGGFSPGGMRARDGKLWFPTQDGVAVVNPALLANNPQPPPVVIESSMVDHVPAAVDGPLTIAAGKENLEILYTALSFINSNQIRFRYKMEGLDSDWVDAGSRRTAYYSHIAPGKYTFQVIAVNRDGVWNSQGQRLQITVLAPFYRTTWFACLAALAVFLVIGAAWYRRGQSFQRAQGVQQAFSRQLIASQESERRRIAGELHDGIGQRLVVINNLALLSLHAPKNATTELERMSVLEEIGAEAGLAIREAREISYDLRPFQLDRLGLTKGIAGILRSVASASKISIDSELDDIDDFFPDDLRINLYRIVQETMNNVLKHAKASRVIVRARRQGNNLILTIEDDGDGFSSGTSSSETSKNGAGLTGMKQRALLLGGKLDIRSAAGHGTIVKFEVVGKEVQHG
jgi:signal transduction histidine kinase/streptogramin lyase